MSQPRLVMNPLPRKHTRSEEELQTDLSSNSQYMNLPTQGQLLLPLLETIHEAGGQAKPNEVYDALATKIELPQWLRQLRALAGKAGEINVWERRVRIPANPRLNKDLSRTAQSAGAEISGN